MESNADTSLSRAETKKMEPGTTWRKTLLVLNCLLLTGGNCGGPLILRLYFIRGGKRVWLSSWIQTAGFPITLIPLFVSYMHRRRSAAHCHATATTKLFVMKPWVLAASIIMGILTGLVDYFYSYGIARIPVSTSSLIVATQLAFTAGFAFLLVKQKFTAFSINAVVLLTVGAAVLALHTSGDRPDGESNKDYALGFVFTLSGTALAGFIIPFLELTYLKAKQVVTYTLVMEIQMVMAFFATAFCTVGMIINKDFQAISREAKQYELGETKYYLVLVGAAISLQGLFLGIGGVVYYGSSLLSGIIITVSLPVTELLAVIFFHEKFQAQKGISLFLSLWGIISYFFGEMKHNKKNICQTEDESEMTRAADP
ncbi:purine permease 3-like [Olea europaea subsp. europaea]|uniref:Probable purine permease n=1 Tax=Olea europaea subsp. europaea TaxID=158383 RepID=A0A8S0UMZ0_OLEEU|nr:purine permease 3-like [Olea europaea subsp. europaea]